MYMTYMFQYSDRRLYLLIADQSIGHLTGRGNKMWSFTWHLAIAIVKVSPQNATQV